VFGVLVFLFTVVLGTLVGIPLATRLARVHVWKRTALPDMPTEREVYRRVRFEPVDFGEDNMRWPSEVTRESHGIPERPWPSQSWDDPHFGQGAKASRERAAHMAAEREKDRQQRVRDRDAENAERNRRAQTLTQQQASQAASSSRSPADRVKQARKRRPRPAPRVQQQPAVEDEWFESEAPEQRRPEPQRQPERRRAKPKPKPKPQAPAQSSGGDGLPDRAAVEKMVAEMGLAGAVQQLMKTQGWDFKTAAAWLGRVRRG
jgi:hypothetical protein